MPDVPIGGKTPPEPQSNQKNTNTIIIGGIVIAVLLVGAYLVFSRNTVSQEESLVEPDGALENLEEEVFPETEPVTEVLPVQEEAQGEVKEFLVGAANFKFTPSEIRVNQGDTVRIMLTNDDTMPHDWRLDEFNAATKVISSGQQDTVEFVAGEVGTFEYYCSVGKHRQMGMVGKLIVE